MTAGSVGQARIEHAKQTWFFQQENGTIIAVQEEEAWRIYSGKNQIIGLRTYPPKLIGTSDGMIYQTAVKEAIKLRQENKFEEADGCLRKGFTDELEHAKKTPRRPRNFDTINKNRQPANISDQNSLI